MYSKSSIKKYYARTWRGFGDILATVQKGPLSAWRAKVGFFISYLEMKEDIKMHRFSASHLNKNANEMRWLLMMQRTGSLFIC